MNDLAIVPATSDESPDFWLISTDGDSFPLHLNELHDMMHLLHDLHDQAHHH
jgi:hypothetical protein